MYWRSLDCRIVLYNVLQFPADDINACLHLISISVIMEFYLQANNRDPSVRRLSVWWNWLCQPQPDPLCSRQIWCLLWIQGHLEGCSVVLHGKWCNGMSVFMYNTSTYNHLWPVRRATSVSWRLQVSTGGLCWSKFYSRMPLLTAPSTFGGNATTFLSGVAYTISIPWYSSA